MSTETKWTPGDWSLSYDTGSTRDVVAHPDPKPVCTVKHGWVTREQFAAEAAREPADYPNPGAHTPLRPAVPSQTPAAQGEAVPVYQWRSRGNGSPFQDNSWYDCSAAYYRNLGEDGFERRILYRLSSAHDLYKKGDADAPAEIRDRNDDVVLCLCRRCGKAEAELDTPCTPPPSAPGVVSDAMVRAALAEADRIRIVEKTGEETRLSVMREVLVAALNAAAQPSADDAPRLRAAIQRMMARLANLLDEDQFAEIEAIATSAGVAPPADARDAELLTLYREFYDRVSDHFGDTHGVDSPQDGDPWWHETNAAYATRETVAAIETLDRSRLDTKIAADNAEHEAWKAKERADRAMGGDQ